MLTFHDLKKAIKKSFKKPEYLISGGVDDSLRGE